LALLILAGLGYLALRAMGAFLITGDRLKPSDVVAALGGGGEWRVEEAVRLVQERYGQALVLTEPGEIRAGEGPGSRYFREAAINQGLSPHAILLTEGVQRSTHDEAEAVLALMRRHQYRSVIVVTDPFHTQRTRMIFRDVFDESGLTVRVHPAADHGYRSTNWFLSWEGWGNTFREYVKIAAFLTGLSRSLD
jgi:uncharacterized SAM-binding protein YcdF (DUF218 family)